VTSQDLGDTFRVSLKADLNPINTNTDGEAQELETGKTHFLTDFLTPESKKKSSISGV